MRLVMLMVLSFLALIADEKREKEKDSFITEKEYAQHLYKNPRGIGCDKCHGKKGEGMVIAQYRHKDEDRLLQTKAITHISYEEFAKALSEKRSVMPKYFLTNKEIRALYNYLHKPIK